MSLTIISLTMSSPSVNHQFNHQFDHVIDHQLNRQTIIFSMSCTLQAQLAELLCAAHLRLRAPEVPGPTGLRRFGWVVGWGLG